MSVETLSSPFRVRENPEKTSLSEEAKALQSLFRELTRRQRAKVPENPLDVDKSPEDISESVGDHIAIGAYLLHYFWPLIEKERSKNGKGPLNYQHTLDMLLVQSIGHLGNLPSTPGVQQTPEERREEIISTAKIFGELPRRNGFGRELFNAYGEYLEENTDEARLAHALSGLATMFYVFSRPQAIGKQLVAGKGYALEDYREYIGKFCDLFPNSVGKFYTLIEKFFHKKEYFDKSREYKNQRLRPGLAKKIFTDNAPEFGDPPEVNADDENERLLRLQRLKRKLRFGQPPKPADEHHDTLGEHVASLFLDARYFLPIIAEKLTEEQRKELTPYCSQRNVARTRRR